MLYAILGLIVGLIAGSLRLVISLKTITKIHLSMKK